MTDVAHQPASISQAPSHFAFERWPLLPYVLVFAAGATGLLVGRALGGDADAYESKLLILLRFMAGIKFLGVLLAAAVLHWRLKQPISPRLAGVYGTALVPMAVAPGLIWSLGGVALGALLFHIGLLTFLYLAWRDGGARLTPRR